MEALLQISNNIVLSGVANVALVSDKGDSIVKSLEGCIN
jgi:hypothetical protein